VCTCLSSSLMSLLPRLISSVVRVQMAYADMAPGPGFLPPGHMAPLNPAASNWPVPLANHPYMNDDRNMRR
jgi:hypothetical protein